MNDSPKEVDFIKIAKNYIWDSVPNLRDSLSDNISATNDYIKASENLFNTITDIFEKGFISKELIQFRDLIYKNNILVDKLIQEQKDYLEHLNKMLYWAKESKYF